MTHLTVSMQSRKSPTFSAPNHYGIKSTCNMQHHLDRIVTNPEICGGRPTIRSTRMRVFDIVDLLAAGETRAAILEDYPYLADDDISAALHYAAAPNL